MPGRKGKHIGFNKLANKVTHFYESKGVTPKRAKKIGKKVAGKQYWKMKRKRK